MLRNAHSLTQLGLQTRDGMTADIEDLYFDDERWIVRYFIVAAHVWGHRQLLLVPPEAAEPRGSAQGHLTVDMSSAEVLSSPPVESDPPVFVQRERERKHTLTHLPLFGPEFTRSLVEAEATYFAAADSLARLRTEAGRRLRPDAHLRSVKHVTGYRAMASDGVLGTVDDLLIHEASWQVAYLVVRTPGSKAGKALLVAPERVTAIQWENRAIAVSGSRDSLKAGPLFDTARPLTLAYAEQLHADFRGAHAPDAARRTQP